LADASQKKLDVMVKALYNRPGLQLEISGSVDPVADRDGLQRIAFDKELRGRAWADLSKSDRALTTPDEMVLTSEQREHWVTKLYDEALGSGQITPALLEANTNLAAIAAKIQKPAPKNEKQDAFLFNKAPAQAQNSPTEAPPSQAKLPRITDPKEALLVALMPVSDSDLETLAITRAKIVRAYILSSGKVEAGRLFLAQSQNGGLREDGCRVYLQLE
jgi:hypothetical protein